MLSGIARRQDLHSEGRGKGNFAPWGLLDWVHGTSIGPDVIDDAKDESDKHNVKERSGKAWSDAKETGKEYVNPGIFFYVKTLARWFLFPSSSQLAKRSFYLRAF